MRPSYVTTGVENCVVGARVQNFAVFLAALSGQRYSGSTNMIPLDKALFLSIALVLSEGLVVLILSIQYCNNSAPPARGILEKLPP